MRRSGLIALALALTLVLGTYFIVGLTYAGGSCGSKARACSTNKMTGSADESKAISSSFANIYAVDKDGNQYAVCPVSGESFQVSKTSSHSEIDGKGYYWCCPGCEDQFKANKAEYSEKLKKMIAEEREKFSSIEEPTGTKM